MTRVVSFLGPIGLALLAKTVMGAPVRDLQMRESIEVHPGEGTPFGTSEFYVKAVLAFALCCVGLTIGYFSLDLTNLEILKVSGEDKQKAMAAKIEPLRANGHLLLITLLLGNVVVNETLPLIMDDLTGGSGGLTAIILSTALVVLFGEWVLINIISAVLDLSYKTVAQVFTPLEDTYSLELHQKMDKQTIREIKQRGVSRVPVYEDDPTNLVAIFLVKQLLDYDPHDCLQVNDFPLAFLPVVSGTTPLFDMLNFFQEGRSHMAAVSLEETRSIPRRPATVAKLRRSNTGADSVRRPATPSREPSPAPSAGVRGLHHTVDMQPVSKVVGIITLEDVVEELIGEEIIDETDEYVDVHTRTPVHRKPWKALKTIAKFISPFQNGAVPPATHRSSLSESTQVTGANGVQRPNPVRRHFLLGQPGTESPKRGPRGRGEAAPLLGGPSINQPEDYGSTTIVVNGRVRKHSAAERQFVGKSSLSIEVKRDEGTSNEGSSHSAHDDSDVDTSLKTPVISGGESTNFIHDVHGTFSGDGADTFRLSRRHSDFTDDGHESPVVKIGASKLLSEDWNEQEEGEGGRPRELHIESFATKIAASNK
ncbi:hypothetical protein HDU93_008357 [Gonapodya sp. JEL0774]|nr:hypothetical protein HDU93_008357 [Gonapodya sp. JEL0774]